jgi:TorA maturation chaperone TorD
MTEWADYARTRQGLYRFLGGALLPPSKDRFALLEQAYSVLDQMDLDRFAFSLAWRRFGRHLPADITAGRLDVEYVRLFASGMSRSLSPPTESYYRVPAKGGGIAEFVASLQREYRALGLVSVGVNEAPDHLSTELEVMSYLCGTEGDAWNSGRETLAAELLERQRNFLRRHLVVWVPKFRSRVEEAQPIDFYRDLIDLVHAVVVHDQGYLSAILEARGET